MRRARPPGLLPLFALVAVAIATLPACRRGAAFERSAATPPAAAAAGPAPASDRPAGGPERLRVCADPNNLPFSNDREEGFENELAALLAADLGRSVEYTWQPQRRGFFRTTLGAGVCDVVMGVPVDLEMARPTRPYYRSTYVFVSRHDRRLRLSSMNDPRLRRLTIGVHLVGDDYASVPPGDALARRHIVRNVRGYSIYGDYAQPDPPAELIRAVARGDVDAAVAWGPLAGYFAARSHVPLDVVPVAPLPDVPFQFSIAMGVRRNDPRLHDALDAFVARRRADIDRILDRFHVPRIETLEHHP